MSRKDYRYPQVPYNPERSKEVYVVTKGQRCPLRPKEILNVSKNLKIQRRSKEVRKGSNLGT